MSNIFELLISPPIIFLTLVYLILTRTRCGYYYNKYYLEPKEKEQLKKLKRKYDNNK